MRRFYLLFIVAFAATAGYAQTDSVKVSDYARAEKMLAGNLAPYIYNNVSNGKWINDNQFSYQTRTPQGIGYITVDATNGSKITLDDRPAGYRFMARSNEVLSPDGKKAAFIKDYNLWMRDVATNQLTQLTTDGVKYYGYATDNAGWKHSDDAILRWSPDSKKIATFQQDERKAGDMYLVSTNVGHPTLQQWKYPYQETVIDIIVIERVIINA